MSCAEPMGREDGEKLLAELTAHYESELTSLFIGLLNESRSWMEQSFVSVAFATAAGAAVARLPLIMFPGDATAIEPVGVAMRASMTEGFDASLAAEAQR